MTETEAIRAAQAGDPEGFDYLYRNNRIFVSRICRQKLKDQNDIEDVVQNAFLSVQKRIKQFRGDAAFQTWLYTVAKSEGLMALRRNKRTSNCGSLEEAAEPGYIPDFDSAIRVERAFSTLEEPARQLAVQKFVEGKSSKEISAQSGLDSSAVRHRIQAVRARLRDALQ